MSNRTITTDYLVTHVTAAGQPLATLKTFRERQDAVIFARSARGFFDHVAIETKRANR